MYHLAYTHSSEKNLIVDDLQVRKLLDKALQRHKQETETAANGFGAGAKVFEFKPGLVVLGLILPDVNGVEGCRQIKQNPETSYAKLLTVTGYDAEENIESGFFPPERTGIRQGLSRWTS